MSRLEILQGIKTLLDVLKVIKSNDSPIIEEFVYQKINSLVQML